MTTPDPPAGSGLPESHFRTLVEASADALALVGSDGEIRYVSPAAARVFGVTSELMIGRQLFAAVHEGDEAEARLLMASALAAPRQDLHRRLRFRHRDGSLRHVECVLVNRLDDPRACALVANLRDVTDRIALEEQFLQAQRMEAVGRLSGGVAHDFNNLLTAILSSSESALELVDAGHPVRRDLQNIENAAEKAAALTRQLLGFSRKQMVTPHPVDLAAILRGLEPMLRRLLGEAVQLEVIAEEPLAAVRADPTQIEQVVLNLALNGRDAMPEGGRLVIHASNVIEAGEGGPPRHVRMVVSDDGTGMAADVRDRVFEPFFTTKPKGQGTGLGMTTVFSIVRQYGGTAWIESEPHRGTRIEIQLPACEQPARDAPSSPAVRERARGGTECILLVEDEGVVRTILQRVLARVGYAVTEAGDGVEALEAFERMERCDLLITDVVMPRMNGPALAERIAHAAPALPVIFMSGYTQGAVTKLSGAHRRFVQKPAKVDHLLRTIRELLDSGPRVEARR